MQCGKLSGRFMCQSDNVQRNRQTETDTGRADTLGREGGKRHFRRQCSYVVCVCVEGEEGEVVLGEIGIPSLERESQGRQGGGQS